MTSPYGLDLFTALWSLSSQISYMLAQGVLGYKAEVVSVVLFGSFSPGYNP